jgi:hypothetical protein
MNDDSPNEPQSNRLGVAGWIAIMAMAGFLDWAIWYAVHTWDALAGVGISTTGWIFIVIGILLTLGLGGGLMALVFYSSRKNYDR